MAVSSGCQWIRFGVAEMLFRGLIKQDASRNVIDGGQKDGDTPEDDEADDDWLVRSQQKNSSVNYVGCVYFRHDPVQGGRPTDDFVDKVTSYSASSNYNLIFSPAIQKAQEGPKSNAPRCV